MNFYLLDDPAKPSVFARFSHVGTWADDRICSLCGESTAHLIEPLQIEWNEGTDRIGDFSWCGYSSIVLDQARTFLEAHAFELSYGRVEVTSPTTATKRARVPFSHHGPRLSWLLPTTQLIADEQRSGITLKSSCSSCRMKRYTFKREGLVISNESWNGEKIFLIDQFSKSGAMFITEQALEMFEIAGFSNLSPKPAGKIGE